MIIKPKALKKNDAVILIAPAGSCRKSLFLLGLDWVKAMGFRPLYREDLSETLDTASYLAGDDNRRVEELHYAFLSPEVKGILCLRGGYGSLRLLPKLDKNIIRDNPKVFIGYSDITVLLNYLTQYCSLVSFHGPMPSEKLIDPLGHTSTQALLKAITAKEPPEIISSDKALTVNKGRGRGRLCGGCLTLVCHSLGTPFEIDTHDKILFLEDIREEPYRIDRMLTHLKLAGKLDYLKGLAFGEILNGKEREGESSYKEEVIRIIQEIIPSPSYPIVYGLPCGHGAVNLPLPLGLPAELDGSTASLRVLENGVQ